MIPASSRYFGTRIFGRKSWTKKLISDVNDSRTSVRNGYQLIQVEQKR